jgi:deazaflavin-dependent oxidoreductase (nitroreductase family)
MPGSAISVGSPLTRTERLVLAIERGLDRWLSPVGVWVMRRTRGAIAGAWKVDALVLTTRGRRSGRQRTVVLRYFPDGDAMILAAANDGGRSHPGWYFNLCANPKARVEVRGRALPVRAEILPSGDAGDWWRRIVHIQPSYDRFARATNRTIPIVRLVPTI